jgi:hypothetical protein
MEKEAEQAYRSNEAIEGQVLQHFYAEVLDRGYALTGRAFRISTTAAMAASTSASVL